jgi:mycoredoxin
VRRNGLALGVRLAGVGVGAIYVAVGRPIVGLVFGAVGLALGWLVLLAADAPGTNHRAVLDLPADKRRVVVYWRPASRACARLKVALLGVRHRVVWVDIRRDPEAAAYVRGVHQGVEVVPTVVIDGTPHPHATVADIRQALTR